MAGSTKSKEDRDSNHNDHVIVGSPVMPPDGGFGWVIVVVGFMGGVVVDGIIFSFGIVFSEILQAFDSGKSQTAWVGSVMAGMYLTVGPIVSALANRYGCRMVCVIGAIIGAIGLFLSAFAQSVEFLIFSYGILGGIGFGFIYLPCIVMVQFYFDKRRAFATGISVCGSGMGAFVFAPLSTYVINHYGWRGNMLIQAAIVTNMIALGGLLRPLEARPKRPGRTSNKPLLQRIKEARDAADFQKSPSSHSMNNGDIADFINENDQGKIANPIDPLKKPFGWSAIGDEISLTPDRTRRYTWSSVGMPASLTIEEAVEEDDEENNSGRTDSASSSTPLTGHLNGKDPLGETRPISLIVTKASPRSTPSSVRRKSLPLEISEEMTKPFYRQDIFYTGSLLRIPQFSSQANLQQYHCSVMSIPKYSKDQSEVDKTSSSCFKSILCPKTMTHTIGTMLDFSLLRSITFLVLCAASFITMMGFFVPFVYLAEYSRSIGISKEDSGLLFSAIGITNTLGRVFSGWVSDRPQVNALLITNVALTTGGLATALVPFLTRYEFLLAYCSTFGLAIACFASLRSIILVELLGLEKLTNAFGLLLLFQGVASIIGSPMAGFFYDITKSYDTSFIIAGSLITLSGLLGFPLPYIAKWESRRRKRNQIEKDVIADTKISGDVADNSRNCIDGDEQKNDS